MKKRKKKKITLKYKQNRNEVSQLLHNSFKSRRGFWVEWNDDSVCSNISKIRIHFCFCFFFFFLSEHITSVSARLWSPQILFYAIYFYLGSFARNWCRFVCVCVCACYYCCCFEFWLLPLWIVFALSVAICIRVFPFKFIFINYEVTLNGTEHDDFFFLYMHNWPTIAYALLNFESSVQSAHRTNQNFFIFFCFIDSTS